MTRVGRWKIQSQYLDGQQLPSDKWIIPKVKPSYSRHGNQREPRAHVLNAHLLENPGSSHVRSRTAGTPPRPSFAELWLDQRTGDPSDSTESGRVLTVVEGSGQDISDQSESGVVVVNNGSAPQKLINQLRNKENLGIEEERDGDDVTDKEIANKNFLTEILEDLDKESQLRRLQLLKERLQHKTEVYQSTLATEANKRLTDVGISLHKQGQVLNHFTALPKENQTEKASTGNTKTQELLQKKRRLQNLLKSLKLIMQARKNFEAFQPTLKHQEEILKRTKY